MNKKKIVVCKHCANLLVVKGAKPFCMMSAHFIDSPLHRRVDVVGMKIATKVNANKNCKKKVLFSSHAWALRRWLKKDLRRKGLVYMGKNLVDYRYASRGSDGQRAGETGVAEHRTDDTEAGEPT